MVLSHDGIGGTRRISRGENKNSTHFFSERVPKVASKYKGKFRSGLGNLGAGLPAHVGSSFFLCYWAATANQHPPAHHPTGCPLFLSCR